ncbi:hypothetical protein E4U42_002614 [Claviceps africana]|uniref:Uncharacterized protein n=1 Tax=Claviceps africana TaxID=83212 RepID=A0A8K0NPF2_9HYPO|nr:hypothetical protein E4U42_002614 [Claviceps africana]
MYSTRLFSAVFAAFSILSMAIAAPVQGSGEGAVDLPGNGETPYTGPPGEGSPVGRRDETGGDVKADSYIPHCPYCY